MRRDDTVHTPSAIAEHVPAALVRAVVLLLDCPATPDPLPMLWRVDDRLTTRAVSGPFAELLGADRADLVGQPWLALMAPEARESLDRLIHAPRYQPTATLELRRADGAAVLVMVRRLHGGRGRPTAVLTVAEVAGNG